jgi:hypothetical protein
MGLSWFTSPRKRGEGEAVHQAAASAAAFFNGSRLHIE